ncbi:hypothetical protein FIBSPDRAFT_1025724 [Athelia psychrophila]|uniref:Uncharacterized protein n=1 Tax=Athelia psychrophila TaxID=1759441 RepID=A0A166HS08_9AGAM|nr:hypothetical protein FIBSPDRAFT_1025724 [Fibularhizoctonia sp. CBS 109695]
MNRGAERLARTVASARRDHRAGANLRMLPGLMNVVRYRMVMRWSQDWRIVMLGRWRARTETAGKDKGWNVARAVKAAEVEDGSSDVARTTAAGDDETSDDHRRHGWVPAANNADRRRLHRWVPAANNADGRR